jgi:hypothetical protein
MKQSYSSSDCERVSFLRGAGVLFGVMIIQGLLIPAYGAQQGPIAPPPEHRVTRIANDTVPEVPPSLPEAEIIKHLAQKEDEYLAARTHFTYRRTVRIQEFGPDGQPAGEYVMVTEPARDVDGNYFEKVVERPHSTLLHLYLKAEDLESLNRVPLFPLTTGQLSKYDLKFLGRELVDEVDCYIFQVKPRGVERTKAYFDGIVWVDAKYLEVVKTYGKWVTDLGEMHSLSGKTFSLFETYRENVEGKYWFPDYARSDDTLRQKDVEIPVRVVIKWTDFKPVAATPANATPQITLPQKPTSAPEKP